MPNTIQVPSGDTLRSLVGPRSRWAEKCGIKVTERRLALGLTEAQLAESVDVSVMTIKRIENGEIVPRDYLRLAIALALVDEVSRLWCPLERPDVVEAATS